MERDLNKKTVPIGQAADFLGVSVDTIRRWDEKGILHSTRPDGKDRYFSVAELDKVKFSQPLTISEAAQKLEISEATLRRLEEKDLIKPERNSAGERIYTIECLEDFLQSDYYLRQETIEDQILSAPETKTEGKSDYAEDVKSLREQHRVINAQIEEQKRHIHRLTIFRKTFQYSMRMFFAVFVLLVAVFTILFLIYPFATARWFGLRSQTVWAADLTKNTPNVNTTETQGKVLGAAYQPKTSDETSFISKVLQPVGGLSLELVRHINYDTYAQIIANQPIRDVNDIFSVDSQGNIVTNYNLTFPDTSYLIIPDTHLINNLNADYLRGKVPGESGGNLISWGENGSITGLKIDSVNLADNSVSNNNIVNGTIDQSKLQTITETNKVTGSAIQLSVSGGLVNQAGLSLKTDCNAGEILNWTGQSWQCVAQNEFSLNQLFATAPLIYDSSTGTFSIDTTKMSNWDVAYTHISDTNNPHNVTANQVLPNQTGQNGKVLGTNGSGVAWISNSSNVAWGAITGILTDQADLVTALAGKVGTATTVNGHALSANVTVTASDLGLGSVENTALSTWVGTSNITTLGTIATGIWHGTAITDTYISSAATWNAKQNALSEGTDYLNKTHLDLAYLGISATAADSTKLNNQSASYYQTALVSGTSIKTINGGSLLAAGDLTLLTSLSGAVLTDQTTPQTVGDTTNRVLKLWATDITATNAISGSVTGNAGTVTTNANLTGDVTSVGNATTLTNAPVIAKVLTGYTSGAGTVAATDSILQAIQKLNGNDATNANLTGPITSVGNATSIASQTGTGTRFVMDTAPTIAGGSMTGLTTLAVRDTSAAYDVTIAATSTTPLTLGRTFTLDVDNAARTLKLGGDLTVVSTASISGTNTGDQTLSGLGGVATTRTLTINGTAQDLSVDRTWSITTITGNAGTATTLATPRTIGGVSFDGSTNITVASATGGFTVSGGDLALGANSLTMTGSIGDTTNRVLKLWATDITATNAISGSVTGNAGTVTTNANLTGVITSVGNATSIASQTGTGTKFVVDTAPTIAGGSISGLTTLAIRDTSAAYDVTIAATSTTPLTLGRTLTFDVVNAARTVKLGGNLTTTADATISGTNTGDNAANSSTMYIGTTAVALNRASASMALTGITSIDGNAATVTTNANLTGDVTSVGNATTLTNAAVIAKVLTGYTSGAGTVAATDSILQAIQKLNGNDATNANLTGVVTSVGNATSFAASPTFTGTVTIPSPFTLGATSVTTTGIQLNYLASAGGTTGTTTTNLVFSTSPTLTTPVLGAATYTTLSGGNITDSGLTAGRNTFAGASGILTDNAYWTWAATSGFNTRAIQTDASSSGGTIRSDNTATVNGSRNNSVLILQGNTIVNSGVTNTNGLTGINAQIYRSNLAGTGDTGTLTNLFGFAFAYGNAGLDFHTSPTTTNVSGYISSPVYQRGTIGTLTQFTINSPSTISTPATWVANTAYSTGTSIVKPSVSNGRYYTCSTSGTSDPTTEPTWNTTVGGTTNDGSVVWTTIIIPSITTQYGLRISSLTAATTNYGIYFDGTGVGNGINWGTGTSNLYSPSATNIKTDGNLTAVGNVTAGNITNSGLTSGRITYAGASGILQDSANLTFNGTTQTISGTSSGASISLLSLFNTGTNDLTASTLAMGASATRGTTIADIASGSNGAGWHDLVFSTSSAASPVEGMRLNRAGQLQVLTPTGIASNGMSQVAGATTKLDVGGGNINVWNSAALDGEVHTQSNAAADPNGTEANATTGWTGVTGTLTSVDVGDTAPQTGSYSLKQVSSGGSSRMEYDFTAKVGAMYKISIWAKRGAQGTNQFFQSWLNLGSLQPSSSVSISSTTWTEYVFYQTATAAAAKIRVYAGSTSGDIVYVDNVSIKEVTGGDVIARGQFTGGGSSGLDIDSIGNLAADKALNLGSGNFLANTNNLYFDGLNDYASAPIGTWAELNSTANFSWSSWLNFDDITDNSYIMVKNVSASNRLIIFKTASNLNFYIGSASNFGTFTLTGVVANGENHHYAISYDGTQATNATKLIFYLDGVAQTLSFTGTIPTALGDMSSIAGRISESSSGGSMHGYIKDWRLYNSTISAANVLSIFQGSSSVATMVHRYKISEGTGSPLLLDTGTNPQNATLTGGTWTSKAYTGVGLDAPMSALSLLAGTTADSGIRFGNDTQLYRTGQAALKTNASLTAGGTIQGTNLAAGVAPVTNVGVYSSGALSGSTIQGSVSTSGSIFGSDATTAGYGIYLQTATAAASFTMANQYGMRIFNPTVGAGSTITTNYGLLIDDQTSGGTADYGLAIAGADTAALWLSSAADNTDAANGIMFGSSKDTDLYRSAANILKTDDAFSSIHLIGNSATPTYAAGTGAGTTPTLSMTGSDTSGIINVTTGTSPTAAGIVVTVTFNTAFGAAPAVVLQPRNAATAALTGATMVYATSTTTTYVITAGSSALTASTAYSWFYQAIQ